MQTNAKDELLRTLHGMLTGEVHLIEGCRIVTRSLRDMDPRISRSESAVIIVGIESETDSFPIGLERQHWAQEALQKADSDLAEYLEQIREHLLDACRGLMEQLRASPVR